jgi:tetratricopeptide (TPR) repeat protein
MQQADSITSDYHSGYRTRALQLGLIYHVMGDVESAQEQFEQARIEMLSKLEELPDDPRVLSSLGVAYAGLGFKKEAISSVQKAMHVALAGRTGYIEEDFLRINIMVGDYDQAMEQLGNTHWGYWELKLDPVYDPLRERADFQALMASAKEMDELQGGEK